jgi:hypothetical protein
MRRALREAVCLVERSTFRNSFNFSQSATKCAGNLDGQPRAATTFFFYFSYLRFMRDLKFWKYPEPRPAVVNHFGSLCQPCGRHLEACPLQRIYRRHPPRQRMSTSSLARPVGPPPIIPN